MEVGPGRGFLTRQLLSRAARVVAIELDRELAADLPARLGDPSNLSVCCEDARTVGLEPLLGDASGYKVVANLPYYAANPIVRRFLECDRPPSRMIVMVQKEVAENMAASPGRMSLLSVATQFYAGAKIICQVAPSCFRPAPRVSSAVVRLDVLPRPAVDVTAPQEFFELVRAGFSAPRKQLRNSLAHGLSTAPSLAEGMLERAGIDGRRRPGTLALEEWAAIFRSWQDLGHLAERGS